MRVQDLLRRITFAALISVSGSTATHAAEWTTFGLSPSRNGFNSAEWILSGVTAPSLGLYGQIAMNGPLLAQPLYLSGVTGVPGRSAPVDLIYAADLSGLVVAIEPRSGARVWERQLPSRLTPCTDFPAGRIGVQGTPTIDRANNRMWMVAADGTLWALALTTGATLSGYPLQLHEPQVDGANTTAPTINYGSPTYFDGALYVAMASQCDITPWHGQLIKVSVGGLGAQPSVAARWYPTGSTGPSGGGIWGPGGVSMESDGSYLYAATGNADQLEDYLYADHVVKLNSDLVPVASDGPQVFVADSDFGATPLLYQPPNCPPQAAVINKSGFLLVYDRSASGLTSMQELQVAVTSEKGNFVGMPTYDPVSNEIFVGNPTDNGTYQHGLLAFAVQSDCTLTLAWQRKVGFAFNGTDDNPVIPPTVANGVVYYATGNASSVYAFDTAGNYLWDSGSQIQGGVYVAPTVVEGLLIVTNYFGGSIMIFGPDLGSQTAIVAATAPTARTTTPGKTITGFATILNTTTVVATSCAISLPANIPASLVYQTTDPGTNTPTGTANLPVNVAGNGRQTFYFAVTPTTTFVDDIPLIFYCTNAPPATSVAGLNTFLVTSTATQLMDMVSIAVTSTGDGIVTLRDSTGRLSFFAGASINIGTAGIVTLAPSTTPFGQPGRTVPVAMSICQTDSAGRCVTPLGSSLNINVATGQTIVYAVFVGAAGTAIPFDPANSRLFLLASQNGAPVGEASVAVRYSPGS